MEAMSDTARGLLYCLVFLVLEAAQAVYFGGVFQGVSSFLVGALVFGTTSLALLAFVAVRTPIQLAMIWELRLDIVLVNVLTASAWIAYFLSVQMIEPAIAFTLFSGALPLTVVIAAALGMAYAEPIGSKGEGISYTLLTGSLVYLVVVTVLDLSGFVRGSASIGLIGALLALFSGAAISLAVIVCRRMNAAGLGPTAQFGVRFVVYTVVATMLAFAGVDAKGEVPLQELALVFVVGLTIIAIPIYAFQRAVPLISAQTIAVATAMGPLIVFGLQMIEGRVVFAPATLVGLMIYSLCALITAGSSIWSARRRVAFDG
jgi:drug/metabolite transporter (DMT)-like permease